MRIVGLDILRGLAIILVIFRHGNLENNIVKNFGWLGVDLFFVISGALISGIVFKEYLKFGEVNIKRFLIRRGFKIYPPFYFFMLFSIIFHWYQTTTSYSYMKIIPEVFFFQNYQEGIWYHTWSLAVEEHFYLTFAILSFVIIKAKLLSFKKTIITSLITLLTISFFLRLTVSYSNRNEEFFSFTQTHLRADGLIIGVLISYLVHFTTMYKIILGWEKSFFVAGIVLVLPGLYFGGGSFIMNTLGLSLVNIGFGIITLISMKYVQLSGESISKLIKIPVNIFCFIGKNSYSIYIWHVSALSIINFVFNKSKEINFALYFILSLILGVGMSYAIEKPFLKLREAMVK